MAFAETPLTNFGNATYLTNAHDIDDFSIENSFISPLKTKGDLMQNTSRGRHRDLTTPRTRLPLTDRRNVPAVSQREFTPLLQSAVKNNALKKEKRHSKLHTPAYLKNGYQDIAVPVLPPPEISGVLEDDTGSSGGRDENSTPVPQIANSSAQSTPLAAIPTRDGGNLADQGNALTLREQENIVTKIDKENFGLKLKIHFLEEGLRKAGPGFNEAALRENTDLKVNQVAIQKELARARKNLTNAEQEVESYRLHLQEVKEKLKRKHEDEGLRHSLQSLQDELASKNSELEDLRRRLDEDLFEKMKQKHADEDVRKEMLLLKNEFSSKESEMDSLRRRLEEDSLEKMEQRNKIEALREEIQLLKDEAFSNESEVKALRRQLSSAEGIGQKMNKVKGDVEDLEAEIREKDRLIEDRDDEIEKLRQQLLGVDDLDQELAEAKDRAEEQEANALKQDRLIRQHEEKVRVLQVRANLVEETEGEMKKVKQYTQELLSEIQKKDNILEKRAQDVDQLQSQARKDSDKIDELNDEIDAAISRIETLQDNAEYSDKQGQKLKKSQDDIQRLSQTIHKLEEDLRKARDEALDARGQTRAELECNRNLENDIAQLRGEMSNKSVDSKGLSQQLEERAGKLQTELRDLRTEYNQLKERFYNQSGELRKTRKEANDAVQDAQELREEISNRSMNTKGLSRHLEGKANKLQSDLHELRQKYSQLEEQFDDQARELRKAHEDVSEVGQDAEIREQKLKDANEVLYNDQRAASRKLQTLASELEQVKTEFRVAAEEKAILQSEHDMLKLKYQTANKDLSQARTKIHEIGRKSEIDQWHEFTGKEATSAAFEAEIKEQRLKDVNESLRRKQQASAQKVEDLNSQLQRITKEDQAKIQELELRLEIEQNHILDFRAQVVRLQDERSHQFQQSTALERELEHLQDRHERCLEKLARQQQSWDTEHRRATSIPAGAGPAQLNVAKLYVSSMHVGGNCNASAFATPLSNPVTQNPQPTGREESQKDQRHAAEIRVLTKQIQWLRAKWTREAGFRAGLAHSKWYLQGVIETHNECNKANLAILARMGVQRSPNGPTPLPSNPTELQRRQHELDSTPDPANKRIGLRSVFLMAVAVKRMSKWATEWRREREIKREMRDGLEDVRSKREGTEKEVTQR